MSLINPRETDLQYLMQNPERAVELRFVIVGDYLKQFTPLGYRNVRIATVEDRGQYPTVDTSQE